MQNLMKLLIIGFNRTSVGTTVFRSVAAARRCSVGAAYSIGVGPRSRFSVHYCIRL